MDEKLLHLLGIARRAGRLALGSEAVLDALRKRKPALVLLASDLSQRTASNISSSAQQAGIPTRGIRSNMNEIEAALGRRTGVIAVNDMGFAKKLLALIAEIEEEFTL
jgi:ribosomal protein L7Ae-like RNA K-turn-binding protein